MEQSIRNRSTASAVRPKVAISGLSGLASGQGTGSNGLGGATRSGGLLNFI